MYTFCGVLSFLSPKFDTSSHRAKELLELVHSDVCGKMREKTIGGSEYFLTFIQMILHVTVECTSSRVKTRYLVSSRNGKFKWQQTEGSENG